jgi:DNA repair protein RecO
VHEKTSLILTGITLRTVPFKERDRIVTFFSPEGIHKLFIGSALGKKNGMALLSSPLSLGEVVVSQGRGSLWRCNEGRLFSAMRGLRSSYETLEAAMGLVDVILRSQLEERPAPALYDLFVFLLNKLEGGFSSKGMIPLFKMKVLLHDGLFGPSPHFSDSEWITLSQIIGGRSLDRIGELVLLEGQIERFFREAVGHGRCAS